MPKDNRPWLKITVDMWRHPKITALTLPQRWALIGLWSISMEFHTDGVLTVQMARDLGIDLRLIKALSKTGSVALSPDGLTIYLHDYLDHQMSAEEIEARTDQRRSAGKKGGQAKARNRSGPLGEERSGPLGEERSGPLSDTRRRAGASEVEKEKEHLPPHADDDSFVTREPRESSSTFADGTPIPPEPPHDDPPPSRGNLALVHDADIPTEIGTAARPHRQPISPAHRATVTTILGGAGYPRVTIDGLAHEVRKLAGKHDAALIAEALREWDRRPNVIPAYLPTVLGDVVKAHRAQPAVGAATVKAQGWLDLANQLPADHPKELP